jgi:hypothetical protein
MADRLPLTEVGGDEILARVTYQIILADYDRWPELYDTPTLRLLELATDWSAPEYSRIHEQITLAAIWVANGGTVATWLRARVVFTYRPASRQMHSSREQKRRPPY